MHFDYSFNVLYHIHRCCSLALIYSFLRIHYYFETLDNTCRPTSGSKQSMSLIATVQGYLKPCSKQFKSSVTLCPPSKRSLLATQSSLTRITHLVMIIVYTYNWVQ